MMRQFSDRAVQALGRHRPIRLVMPLFQKLMGANLEKELEKDRLVIEAACEVFDAGGTVVDVDTDVLFERTKLIDRRFVEGLSGLPISLRLDYRQIRPVRIRRIEHLLAFVYQLCREWRPDGGLGRAARMNYTPADFQRIVAETLSLYAQETSLICESANLRGPARIAGRLVTERVRGAMEGVRDDIARDIRAQVFDGQTEA